MERSMFTNREWKDIIVSVLALSFVFAYPEVFTSPVFLLFSIFAVGVAFMGHELSHRFVARRLGYWAEYRMWNQGILLALLMAFATNGGLIFAAPGAVVFSSRFFGTRPGRSDVGLIGISGVVFNVILMYALLLLGLTFPSAVLSLAAFVNGWLAVFNLIPFGPLDGRKVLSWSSGAWAGVMALAVLGIAANILLL